MLLSRKSRASPKAGKLEVREREGEKKKRKREGRRKEKRESTSFVPVVVKTTPFPKNSLLFGKIATTF